MEAAHLPRRRPAAPRFGLDPFEPLSRRRRATGDRMDAERRGRTRRRRARSYTSPVNRRAIAYHKPCTSSRGIAVGPLWPEGHRHRVRHTRSARCRSGSGRRPAARQCSGVLLRRDAEVGPGPEARTTPDPARERCRPPDPDWVLALAGGAFGESLELHAPQVVREDGDLPGEVAAVDRPTGQGAADAAAVADLVRGRHTLLRDDHRDLPVGVGGGRRGAHGQAAQRRDGQHRQWHPEASVACGFLRRSHRCLPGVAGTRSRACISCECSLMRPFIVTL